jgi:hypothetical protein
MPKKWPSFSCDLEYIHDKHRNAYEMVETYHNLNGVTVMLITGRKRWWQVVWKGRVHESTSLDRAFHKMRNSFPRQHKAKLDRVGSEIIAYRGWGLVGDILVPATRCDDFETWTGPVARAEMDGLDGRSGLYAVKLDARFIRALIRNYGFAVHGFVEIRGTVCEHQDGYRSTIQAIRLLRVKAPVSDKLIELLGDRYQCQVLRVRPEDD